MDLTKIQLGVCNVTFNGVDLGATKGGVELSYKGNWHYVTADQTGTTKLKKYLIGEEASAKTNLLEKTADNLVAACAGAAQKIIDGAKTKVIFGRSPGFQALSYVLTLHPIASGASVADDVTIYKASGTAEISQGFKLDDETVIPVTFEALADPTRTDGDYLMAIGDPTANIDLVAPTISSTTPADGAVGVDKAVTTTIQINFDKAMNPATIVAANLPVYREDTYAQIAGAWSYVSAQNRAVFTADEQWPASTKIVYVITANVKSANNVALAASATKKFTTGA
jgi:hypothetical protein